MSNEIILIYMIKNELQSEIGTHSNLWTSSLKHKENLKFFRIKDFFKININYKNCA